MYVLAAHGYRSRFRLKPRPIASLTGLFGQKTMQSCLDIFAACRLPAPREIRDDALESHAVFFFIFVAGAGHQNISYLNRYLLKRDGFTCPHIFAESFYQSVIIDIHSFPALSPGSDCAVFERYCFIRHNQVRVEFEDCSQPIAAFARTIGAIKTE